MTVKYLHKSNRSEPVKMTDLFNTKNTPFSSLDHIIREYELRFLKFRKKNINYLLQITDGANS